MNINKIFYILFIMLIGCENHQCPSNSVINVDDRVRIYKGKEIVTSRDGDKEIIKGMDKCPPYKVLYISEIRKIPNDSSIKDGYYKVFYPNGAIRLLTFYKNGVQDSVCVQYWPNGNIKTKSFKIKGKFYGRQETFYKNGSIQRILYIKQDTSCWFLAEYDTVGRITKIHGQCFRLLSDQGGFSPTHVGDELAFICNVAELNKTKTILNIRVRQKNRILIDKRIEKFDYADNSSFIPFVYRFTSKGSYKYFVSVKLVDSTSNSIIKQDTFSNALNIK